MSRDVEDAIAAHARFGLLIDAHIIVLYVVGLFDSARISTFHANSKLYRSGILMNSSHFSHFLTGL